MSPLARLLRIRLCPQWRRPALGRRWNHHSERASGSEARWRYYTGYRWVIWAGPIEASLGWLGQHGDPLCHRGGSEAAATARARLHWRVQAHLSTAAVWVTLESCGGPAGDEDRKDWIASRPSGDVALSVLQYDGRTYEFVGKLTGVKETPSPQGRGRR